MKYAVSGIASTTQQANAIIEALEACGFPKRNISLLFPDGRAGGFVRERNTKAPEAATAGGVAGLGVGGALGLLAGIGALTIPGIGPFVAAGPIMAALSGAAVGGATGGIIGGLVGLGISENEAKHYDDKVRAGALLISVQTEDDKSLLRAREVLRQAGAKDVSAAIDGAAPVS